MPRTIISSSLLLRLIIFIVAELKTLFNTWVKFFQSQQVVLTHMWAYTLWKIKSTKWYFWTRTITSKRFYMIIDFRLQTQWQFMHSLIVILFFFFFWQMMICHKKHFHANNWLKGLILLFLPFDLTCFMLSTTMSSFQRNQQKPIAWHWNNQIFAYNFIPSYLLGPNLN